MCLFSLTSTPHVSVRGDPSPPWAPSPRPPRPRLKQVPAPPNTFGEASAHSGRYALDPRDEYNTATIILVGVGGGGGAEVS